MQDDDVEYEDLNEETRLAVDSDHMRQYLAIRIQEWRKSENVSSTELSKKAGISTKILSEIEHCRRDARMTEVVRIARAFGDSAENLTRGLPGWSDQADQESDIETAKMLVRELHAILQGQIDQLTPNEKAVLMQAGFFLDEQGVE